MNFFKFISIRFGAKMPDKRIEIKMCHDKSMINVFS